MMVRNENKKRPNRKSRCSVCKRRRVMYRHDRPGPQMKKVN